MDQPFTTAVADNSIRSYNMLPSQAIHQTYPTSQQSPTQNQQQRQQQQEQSYQNYHQQVTVQPVPIPQKSAHANTFVHKLYK
jgi:hypothetical protein